MCLIMSKIPADYSNISSKLKIRFKEIIEEEDWYNSKISNAEIASRIGVDKSVISNLINYEIIPSVQSLIKIADYFNISLEFLLGKADKSEFIKSDKPSTFGIRVLQLKEESKAKYSDITNSCSFSRNSIHVWVKRNNVPSLVYLMEIANYFNVSPDYLLGRTDFKN